MKNVKDAAQSAGANTTDISNRLSNYKDQVQDAAEKAGTNLRDYYEQKRSELSELADDFSTTVRNKPIQTSLIAVAFGFLLGKLLSR